MAFRRRFRGRPGRRSVRRSFGRRFTSRRRRSSRRRGGLGKYRIARGGIRL